MPVLKNSTYRPSPLLINGHLETIAPALFRKVTGVHYERERLVLLDDDFVDLDWLDNGSRNLVVLTHGLEGSSDRQYMAGMARMFFEQKWDVLAWNCRSCSGEMNKALRMYHHGEIGDFGEVIDHALATKDYEKIALVGFSMGGNISMKYVGTKGKSVHPAIRACVAFSSPTNLESSADILDRKANLIYKKRFLKNLKIKLETKSQQYPGMIPIDQYHTIQRWRDFDELFSAPMNNYENAAAFYSDASAENFMPGISIPTLLVQAKNDPILPARCYPYELCEKLPSVYLETPAHGGHVGFWWPGKRYAWSEKRVWQFLVQTSGKGA